MSRILRACAGTLLCAVCLVAKAATGDWDHSFGADGRVSLTPAAPLTAIAWEPQPDGKAVIAAHPQTTAYLLARFNANGTPDTSFDGDGVVSFAFGGNTWGNLDLKLLPDGRMLFAAQVGGPHQIKLVRLNTDGSPDTSFGVNGEFTLTHPNSVQKPHLALATDGSVILAATSGDGSTDQNIVVARVLTSGTLDPSFGNAGVVEIGSPAASKEAKTVAVQANGAVVVGGTLGSSNDPEPFVARVTGAGQLDTSFGTNGIASLPVVQRYGYVDRVVAAPDGRIFAGGMSRDLNGAVQFFVARLRTNGSLDSSFGSAGRIILDGIMQSMLLEPSGRLVAAGFVNDLAPALAWIARFNTDGSPDVTFGLRGRSRSDFSLGAGRLRVIDSQIRRVADGSYRSLLAIAADSGSANYAVARFVASGASAAVMGLRSGSEASILSSVIRVPEGVTRQVTIYRTGGTEGTVSVQYRLVGQSAQAGQDFVAADGTVTFNDGETSKVIDVQVVSDGIREGAETFYVELFAPTDGAALSRSRLNVEIVSDSGDWGSSVGFVTSSMQAVDTVHATERAGSVRLLVRRTGNLSAPLAVNYATLAGTATAGADFTAASGSVSWNANEGGIRTIDISIANDAVVESDEQFSIALSTGSTGVFLDENAVIQIGDDDDAAASPTLSFRTSAVTVSESASAVTIEVQRMGDPSQAVSATWNTRPYLGFEVAREDVDYTAANGVVSWSAGDVSPKTFTVPILEDALAEGVELFSVSLMTASPAGFQPGGNSLDVAILDNEAAPSQVTISIAPGTSVDESVGATHATLNVTGIVGNDVSVTWVIRAETATGADVTLRTGIARWNVGEPGSQGVPLDIIDDALDETNETFIVSLFAAQGGAQIGTANAQFTIVDNDPTPPGQNPPVPPAVQLSASSLTVGESDRVARLMVARVSGEFDVRYAVVAGTAGHPADYFASTGTLTWTNGDTAPKPFEILLNGDAQLESDETFDIVFTPVLGALTFPSSTARVTIVDDDELGSWPARIDFLSSSQTVNESATSVTLQVARSDNSAVATSVDYVTVAGTATSADFAATSGTLTWGANDSSIKLITIALLADSEDEADESFSVELRNVASGAELGATSVNVSIVDDDAAPGTPTPNPPDPNPPTQNPGPTPNPPASAPSGGGGGGEESLITLLLWTALVAVRHGKRRGQRKLPPTIQSH